MIKGRGYIFFPVVLMAATVAWGQGYLSGPALNKKIVTDFYRLVYEPRNADLADQFIAPDYIEHDPSRDSGRDGLVKAIKALPAPASDDLGSEMKNPPALITAEADLVTFIFKHPTPDPKDSSRKYDRFSFDTYRIRNNKIVEHWDGDSK